MITLTSDYSKPLFYHRILIHSRYNMSQQQAVDWMKVLHDLNDPIMGEINRKLRASNRSFAHMTAQGSRPSDAKVKAWQIHSDRLLREWRDKADEYQFGKKKRKRITAAAPGKRDNQRDQASESSSAATSANTNAKDDQSDDGYDSDRTVIAGPSRSSIPDRSSR
jgi:hypothetical protein